MILIKDYISDKSNKWSGHKLTVKYITIHNTGNPKSTARGERAYLENPKNTSKTGYHIVIDDKEAIQVAPLDMVMYHAPKGNFNSIGIEICESGDYNKSILNAIDVVAKLLIDFKLTVKDLKQHYDWSGKDCPRLIRKGYMGWDWKKFTEAVEVKINQIQNPIKLLVDKNIILSSEYWSYPRGVYLGEYCKQLLVNYYRYATNKYSFTFSEVIDYLITKQIISDKNYWLENCVEGKFVKAEHMKVVIDRISKLL